MGKWFKLYKFLEDLELVTLSDEKYGKIWGKQKVTSDEPKKGKNVKRVIIYRGWNSCAFKRKSGNKSLKTRKRRGN